MADHFWVSRQMVHQSLMAGVHTDVRREVALDVVVFVGVVTVSFNHGWSVFDRFVPYRHVGAHARPVCRIVLP